MRIRRSKGSRSPIPDDPFQPQVSSYVRAMDGNPIPTKSELEARARPARPSSPSILPGVKPLGKELSSLLRDHIVPGKFYARSMSQYLGPFDREPSAEDLPSGDSYFILQEMGKLGDTGKCIYRNIGKIDVPGREIPRRPISPTELPGVRSLNHELDEEAKNNLVPGPYYAKSISRYLGPYDDIPSSDQLPAGESYIIFQRMGRLPNGTMILQKITQIDR